MGDFDFSRSDKLYHLRVPAYSCENGVIFYEFDLKDLIYNETYVTHFRYNELKNIHEQLDKLDFELPPFPVTHFWTKTNNNPQLIEKRRAGLEAYFSRVINDPFLRGYKEVKRIIALCKKKFKSRRNLSNDKKTEITLTSDRTRCHSASKSKTGEVIAK